jgi:predicted negative regulator of RcsB-dependent stress response
MDFLRWSTWSDEVIGALIAGVLAGVVAAVVAGWQIRAARAQEVRRDRRAAFGEVLIALQHAQAAIDQNDAAYDHAELTVTDAMTRWRILARTSGERRFADDVVSVLTSALAESASMKGPRQRGEIKSDALSEPGSHFRELRDGLFKHGIH